MSDAPTVDLFAAPAADLALEPTRSLAADRGLVVYPVPDVIRIATDGDGRFWPCRAVDYIAALGSHAARAAAFREIPAAYRLMAQRMLHRAIYNVSMQR